MNGGTAIAAAIGGLVAAEATGITNLSGGQGQQNPILPSRPNSPIPVPSGDSSGIGAGQLAAIMSSQSEDSGGIGGGELAAILSATKDKTTGSSSQIQALLDRNKNLTEQLIEDKTGGGNPGIWPGDWNIPGTGGPGTTKLWGGTPNPGRNKGAEMDGLQSFFGTGPLGDTAAFLGEGGVALGDTVNATGSAVNDTVEGTGSIIGNPRKVLSGNGANAGGILGESYSYGALAGQGISEFEAPKVRAPKIKAPKWEAPKLDIGDIKPPDISNFPTTGFL